MGSCIKDLYDYDLVKKCCRCGIVKLKSFFYKRTLSKDGLYNQYKVCRKEYYMNNSIKLNQKQKDYQLENRVRIKEYQIKNHDKIITRKKIYSNNRYETVISFRLICRTRSRIRQALRGNVKSISTREILGIDIDPYRKFIKCQFTPEMNWTNIEIDHVKPICVFDVSKDEELKEAFSWKNTQPLLKHDHQLKGTKFNFLDYQIQSVNAYQFIKLNGQEGVNQDFY